MSALNADELYNKLINNKAYFSVDADLNRDGILDKVISSKAYEGDELYFFINMDGNYKLAYKGKNFSADGGNIIGKIQAYDKGNIVLSLQTFFPDRGTYEEVYYISFKDNNWFLTDVKYTTSYWQEDYSKTYNCNVMQNLNLNSENLFERIKPIPIEQERDNLCEIDFYMEDTLDAFIMRFQDKSHEKVYLGINRYKALLDKFPLSLKTLTQYNNIAYYLEQAGAYEESIFLLEKIIEKYPKRTVAYLNLRDAYYGKGDKGKAKEYYKIYTQQMREKAKR